MLESKDFLLYEFGYTCESALPCRLTRETRKYFTKLEPYIETIQRKYERVEDNYLK